MTKIKKESVSADEAYLSPLVIMELIREPRGSNRNTNVLRIRSQSTPVNPEGAIPRVTTMKRRGTNDWYFSISELNESAR